MDKERACASALTGLTVFGMAFGLAAGLDVSSDELGSGSRFVDDRIVARTTS